jgi:hypothetical protein
VGSAARLREAVEEDHDVGVPLRVLLVHPEVAAASADPPVHASHPVAEHERPQVGELDSLPFAAGELVPAEELGLRRAEQVRQRLRPRVDP